MTVTLQSIQQLSRFFFASHAGEIKASCLALAEEFPAPAVDDWSAVEFSFNRLFVGPHALQAPPYASVYLDADPSRLMGESALQMRQLYEMLGLVSPWLNKIPDDHIALELDALWQIETALSSTDTSQLADVRSYLLAHLMSWVPLFTARIRSVQDVHPALISIADTLDSVLSHYIATTTLQGAEQSPL